MIFANAVNIRILFNVMTANVWMGKSILHDLLILFVMVDIVNFFKVYLA